MSNDSVSVVCDIIIPNVLPGILFPVLLTLRHITFPVFLAISGVMGVAIAPLPTVTNGVITTLLVRDKLNDAFG